MLKIKFQGEFHGPDLIELEGVLDDIASPIEVSWGSTLQEFTILRRLLDSTTKDVVLHVDSVEKLDKACSQLGAYLQMDDAFLEAGRNSLLAKGGDTWKKLVQDIGPMRANMLLTKLVSRAIISGKKPRPSVSILSQCYTEGVSPIDADILLRLRAHTKRV